jgi:hypothetical protein
VCGGGAGVEGVDGGGRLFLVADNLRGGGACVGGAGVEVPTLKTVASDTYTMGNYSWLVATRNAADSCRIRWELADVAKLRGGEYNYRLKEEILALPIAERPQTLGALAAVLDDSKFVGYLDAGYIGALQELGRILEPVEGGCFPRIYYEYEGWDEVWFFEFYPGTERVVQGVRRFTAEKKAEYPQSPEDDGRVGAEITDAEWDAHEEAYSASRKALMARAPEMSGWRVSELVHVPMTEAESLRALVARMYG